MSRIATTVEQSEKLHSAGLLIETADMYYYCQAVSNFQLLCVYDGENISRIRGYHPAWSLSKLIDIAGMTATVRAISGLPPYKTPCKDSTQLITRLVNTILHQKKVKKKRKNYEIQSNND